MGSESFKREL